ncbi:phage tail fiber protein [Burkholderia cenocepacia]|uniref:phage tail fiber domain-containing protein n=1 Tax=Burkholderia cenocepacia TaxID=95486 RepID=UPI0023B994C2|nr:phage tail fiber protein [Burkholderia cenocepacia]MDF0504839.1 phage tail fiber protein [Burkholderia cenocepacia]
MFYSRATYSGTGAVTPYAVTYPYISKDHVEVRIDDVLTTAFTWINSSTISLSAPSGSSIEVRRNTPKTPAEVTYYDGSTLTESDLNLETTQLLYSVQEAIDEASTKLGFLFPGSFNALGHRIVNLGAPQAATDASTKKYVDDTSAAGDATVRAYADAGDASVRAYSDANDQLTLDAAKHIAEQVSSGAAGAMGTFIQDGVGAVARTFQSKMRETVSAADFFIAGEADWTGSIQRAINYLQSKSGGTVLLPGGTADISDTLVISKPYITLKGQGGAIDGNQPFQDTWENIVSSAGTRLRWKGTAASAMLLISPPDVATPVSAPLQGGGIDGVMFDCNNIAQIGWKILSTRAARYRDSSVVRHTAWGMVLGVTTHDLYNGGSGTNTSLSLCEFDNICVSTAMLPGNTAKSVLMFGNGLKGGVNQCVFKNNQWFNADYVSRHIEIENSDDNVFISCRWNGTLALHASDTGAHSVTNAFPGTLAQNHFFYFPLGRMEVLTTAAPISSTNLPSFGHGVWGHSGNLPGFTANQQIVVGSGADISVFGSSLDFANRQGFMSWGTQPAITNCYRNTVQSIPNSTLTTVSWSGAQYDRLERWSSSAATSVSVPNNVKWASITLYVTFDNNGAGQRYAGIFLNGIPVAENQVMASGVTPMTVPTGVIAVTPGQVIDARVSQASGAPLNLLNTARMTVEWH